MTKKKTGLQGASSNGLRVTLRDIAEEVGVSIVSVSLALRNSPRVSEKTRAKVRKVARELGYEPDPMLKALSTYRRASQRSPVSSVIAWIGSSGSGQEPEARRCLEGASEAARKNGYSIDEFDVDGMRPVRVAQILETRGIRGIIVHASSSLDLQEFPCDRFSIIQIGWQETFADTYRVSPAYASNTLMALSEMRSRGYRRIGYVGSEAFPWDSTSGCLRGLSDYLDDIEFSVLSLANEKGRLSMLNSWIRENRLDAVLSDVEEIAERLRETGYAVPGDIAVAVNSVCGGTSDMAGINPKLDEVGRVALTTLSNLIEKQEYGLPSTPYTILINGEWVDGDALPFKTSETRQKAMSVVV